MNKKKVVMDFLLYLLLLVAGIAMEFCLNNI